jgi:hypothetical protein
MMSLGGEESNEAQAVKACFDATFDAGAVQQQRLSKSSYLKRI